MENKRTYKIEINGIEQSIKQVDALSDALQFLDKKIKELESRSVSITSSNNGGGSNRIAELSTEDKLLKQIQSTEQQIRDARREDYQSLLAQKDILKETKDIQEQRAAAERLSIGGYGNTMKGLKEELSDIKKVMQTTDLGDEKFQELTQKASELTNKLKELEQAYGQFGRNVGNYPGNVGEGFSKLQIEVNGVTREFDNARQALKELTNERNTLKLMNQDVGDLDEVVKTLKSDIKDMEMSSAAMDGLLDSMEGLIALGSTAEGFASLFGFDNGAIEETIQKLVALQNILQGIEVIKKQMQTGEGIGGMFAKGNAAIDSFTKKLFGVNTAAKTTNATLTATSTAGKSAATGLATASAAANTATKSFSLASAAATVLRVALSAIGIGLVIGAISLLIEGINTLISKQAEAKKYQEDLNKATESGQKAYADAKGELIKYQVKLDKFNGSKKQEKQLVDELNSKYGQSLGTYKTLAEWKRVLKERGETLCTVMLNEAKAQALLNIYTEKFVELQKAQKVKAEGGDTWEWLPWNWGGKSAQQKADEKVKTIEDQMKEITKEITNIFTENEELKQKYNLFDYAPQIEKGSSSSKNAIKKAESELTKLKLELMKDGLAKTILQLRNERAARIKAAKETGVAVAEQTALINKLYDRKEIEARQAHYKKLVNMQKAYQDEMARVQAATQKEAISNSKIANQNKFDDAQSYSNASPKKFFDLVVDYNKTDIHTAIQNYWKDLSKTTELTDKVKDDIREAFTQSIASIKGFRDYFIKVNETLKNQGIDEIKFNVDSSTEMLEAIYPKELGEDDRERIEETVRLYNESISVTNDIIKKYGDKMHTFQKLQSKNLFVAFEVRFNARKEYYQNILKASKEFYDKELLIHNTELDDELKAEEEAEDKRYKKNVGTARERTVIPSLQKGYNEAYNSGEIDSMNTSQIETYFAKYKEELDKWLDEQDEALKKGKLSIEEYTELTSGKLLESYRNKEITFVEFLDNMRQEDETHQNKLNVIEKKGEVKREENQKQHLKNMQQATSEYFSNIEQELSNYISSISRQRDKATVKNAWGIINYGKTKAALKELQADTNQAFQDIAQTKADMIVKLEKGEISFGDFDKIMTQLDSLEAEVKITEEGVSEDFEDFFDDFWASINQWVQVVGQTVNQVLGSIAEIQSNQYDKMIEQQEKYIEEYEELLNKQKDITQEHASAVESIEDELSKARGDRRQQLIDQLNAEMAAQRASLAQEKKIDREREKAEDKKKKLEHDQAVAKKKMQLAQAAINMALSISMAAVNHWPIPAVPMMALAAAVGAAQVAAIQSQNIPSYGSGGVIQGKSHREGGVPAVVGNSPIELEGNEFIIRKKSTIPNLNLLDFVNRSEKKLSLEDLINFYTNENGMRKRTISNSPRNKFADGGTIPTLRNDINLSDRLLTAFEDYSNRPQVVSVVEIVDKMQTVREVQAMAGLSTDF